MKYEVIMSGGFTTNVLGVEISDDELHIKEWRSHYDDRKRALIITSFCISERQTKRHAYRVVSKHSVYEKRGNTLAQIPEPPEELSKKMLDTYKAGMGIRIMEDV